MNMKQAQSILDMLNQNEASLRANFEKQGTTMDPATQFTLDQLRQTLEQGLTKTKQDLNARGLLDSGIELQLENNLQKGSASDAANILGQRMSKLQDQLNTGLQNIGNQRFSTMSQFGLAGTNAQNASDQNAIKLQADRQQQALQAMLGLRQQTAQEQYQQQSLAQQAQLAAQQQAFTGSQNDLNRSATAANDAANRQQALQLAAMSRALAGTGGSAARAGTGAAPATAGAGITSGAYQSNASATSAAQDALRNNFDLTDPQGAAAAADFVKQNAKTFAANGADPNKLLADIQGDIFGAGSEWNTGPYGMR